MRNHWRLLLLLFGLPLAAQSVAPTWSADEVIRHFLERCLTTTNRIAAQHHGCVRHTVIEELNAEGAVKKRKTRDQAVEMQGERQVLKLLKLDDRSPSERESRQELEKETELKQRYAERRDKARPQGPDFVDEKLVRKFDYVADGLEVIAGRPAYVLRFSASAKPPAGDATDRALNLLVGRIWVDAAEYELVKVDAHLKAPVTVLGGLVASIQRLDFVLERRRLADGFWFNTALGTWAEGRKLFSGFHVRSRLEQENFHALTPP